MLSESITAFSTGPMHKRVIAVKTVKANPMIMPSRAANEPHVNYERQLVRKLFETGSVPILLP